MSKNPYELGEVSRMMQRNLKKSKRKYDTFDILCTLRDYVIYNIDDTNLTIELSTTELLIMTTKKKNNKMKEVKKLIDDMLSSLVDEDDVDLIFNINASKSNVCVKCKRKIEH